MGLPSVHDPRAKLSGQRGTRMLGGMVGRRVRGLSGAISTVILIRIQQKACQSAYASYVRSFLVLELWRCAACLYVQRERDSLSMYRDRVGS